MLVRVDTQLPTDKKTHIPPHKHKINFCKSNHKNRILNI